MNKETRAILIMLLCMIIAKDSQSPAMQVWWAIISIIWGIVVYKELKDK